MAIRTVLPTSRPLTSIDSIALSGAELTSSVISLILPLIPPVLPVKSNHVALGECERDRRGHPEAGLLRTAARLAAPGTPDHRDGGATAALSDAGTARLRPEDREYALVWVEEPLALLLVAQFDLGISATRATPNAGPIGSANPAQKACSTGNSA